MKTLIRLIISIIPSSILEDFQDEALRQLDKRGLIIWAEDLKIEEKK